MWCTMVQDELQTSEEDNLAAAEQQRDHRADITALQQRLQAEEASSSKDLAELKTSADEAVLSLQVRI